MGFFFSGVFSCGVSCCCRVSEVYCNTAVFVQSYVRVEACFTSVLFCWGSFSGRCLSSRMVLSFDFSFFVVMLFY